MLKNCVVFGISSMQLMNGLIECIHLSIKMQRTVWRRLGCSQDLSQTLVEGE
jgi:hypothetical protein